MAEHRARRSVLAAIPLGAYRDKREPRSAASAAVIVFGFRLARSVGGLPF